MATYQFFGFPVEASDAPAARQAAATAWLQQFNKVDLQIMSASIDFATVQAAALLLIQEEAENARGLIITLRPGKIGEYTQKRAEVEQWQANLRPTSPLLLNEDNYPIAKAEAPTWNYTTAQMLQVWEQKIQQWSAASAHIVETERTALNAISVAADIETIVSVLAGLDF